MADTDAAGDLPDVNVWIALSAPYHAKHPAARQYWETRLATRVWFCRHTALGLKRLLCQASIMGEQVKTTQQAWVAWQSLMELHEVGMMTEPDALDAELQRLAQNVSWPGPMWSDAYLAAFATSANLRIVSFDRDFLRFPGLNWLHLT